MIIVSMLSLTVGFSTKFIPTKEDKVQTNSLEKYGIINIKNIKDLRIDGFDFKRIKARFDIRVVPSEGILMIRPATIERQMQGGLFVDDTVKASMISIDSK